MPNLTYMENAATLNDCAVLKKNLLHHVMQLYNIQLKWHSFHNHVSVMASYTLNLTGLLFA